MADPLPQTWDYQDEESETAARLDAEAEAEIDAGRFISGEALVDWLRSWADGRPKAMPEDGA